MAGRDLIAIGTSAGGVEALMHLVRGLPSGLPASLFVVCHFPTGERSVLPEILSRSGPLLATHAGDGEPFYPGHIYVAPPGRHLLLGPDGRMRLSRGARENHHRPAIDPLFRTAARYFGPRVVGVILSGALDDGTAGLLAVRGCGGVAVAQDPEDALVPTMPRNAARVAGADHVVRVAELPALLVRLVQEPVDPGGGAHLMDPIEQMPAAVERDRVRQVRDERRGEVSLYTCPECGGALWQLDDAGVMRFRCHVGHAYLGEVLLSEQTEALEAALWTAVRTFRDKSILAAQLAHRERAAGQADSAARFEEQAAQAARFGRLIEDHLLNGAPGAGEGGP